MKMEIFSAHISDALRVIHRARWLLFEEVLKPRWSQGCTLLCFALAYKIGMHLKNCGVAFIFVLQFGVCVGCDPNEGHIIFMNYLFSPKCQPHTQSSKGKKCHHVHHKNNRDFNLAIRNAVVILRKNRFHSIMFSFTIKTEIDVIWLQSIGWSMFVDSLTSGEIEIMAAPGYG